MLVNLEAKASLFLLWWVACAVCWSFFRKLFTRLPTRCSTTKLLEPMQMRMSNFASESPKSLGIHEEFLHPPFWGCRLTSSANYYHDSLAGETRRSLVKDRKSASFPAVPGTTQNYYENGARRLRQSETDIVPSYQQVPLASSGK